MVKPQIYHSYTVGVPQVHHLGPFFGRTGLHMAPDKEKACEFFLCWPSWQPFPDDSLYVVRSIMNELVSTDKQHADNM